MLTNIRLLPAATAVVVLALAGCSASEPGEATAPAETTSAAPEDASAAPDEETGTPTDVEPDAEATDDEAAEPAEPTETETSASAGAGDAVCLQGSWLYAAAEVEKTFLEMMSQVPEAPINDFSVEGDALVTFDGSTIRQEYDPQVWSISAGPESMNMTMVMTMDGHSIGEYRVEDDMFYVTSIDTDAYELHMKVLVDGKEMDGLGDLGLGDLIGQTGASLPEGQVRFACAGDQLTLTAIAPDSPGFEFSYSLSRQ
ncbi:MAG: hypothetical protein GX593_08065 [Actinomycetales bacterium]|nr:hypothetical protein [Actinomycetales bacterium]